MLPALIQNPITRGEVKKYFEFQKLELLLSNPLIDTSKIENMGYSIDSINNFWKVTFFFLYDLQ